MGHWHLRHYVCDICRCNRINNHGNRCANYAGPITIYYGISDGNGGTDIGTVKVSNYFNMPPVAIGEQATTNHLTAITVDVLANDNDIEGGSLQLQQLTTDSGSVEIIDKIIHFTPQSGFAGIVTIGYQVVDSAGAIAVAQLLVTVTTNDTITKTTGGSSQTLLLFIVFIYWIRYFALLRG